MSTDAELLSACRAGDREAWAALIARHGPAVLRVVRRMGGDEDLAQELWTRLMEDSARRLEGVDPERPFRPWLVAAALNLCRRRLSEEKRRGLSLEEAWALPSPGGGPEATLQKEERRKAVAEALEGLSGRDRLLLTLVEVQGIPHAEAARILGVAASSVGTLLARAKGRLKERLEAP